MNFGDWEGQETQPLRDKYPDTFDFRGTFSHDFTIRGILAGLFHIDITGIAAVNNVSFTEISLDEDRFFAPCLLSFNR